MKLKKDVPGISTILQLLVLLAFIVADQTVIAAETAEPVLADNAQMEEVEVYGSRRKLLSEIDEDTQRLFSVAGAAEDPLQSVFALPGVTFANDGEPVIRGSAPQDNAYYIDLVPATYLFHFFGNSILNKNLVHKFELYPAAFPSQFGNATGGVIDVTLREPRDQELITTFNWSFLITGIMVESAISEDQAFYASYRRSMLDQFYDEDEDDDAKKEGYEISKFPVAQDYQLKYSWYVNPNNSLSFVAAGASDIFKGAIFEKNDEATRDPALAGPVSTDVGFDSQGVFWYWNSDDKSKSLTTHITHMTDLFDVFYGVDQKIDLHGEHWLLRSDYSQAVSESHRLSLGIAEDRAVYDVDVNAKIVACSDFEPDCPTLDAAYIRFADDITVNSRSAFVEDEYQLTVNQTLIFGVHYTRDSYLQEAAVEPRMRWNFRINNDWSSYIAAGQYSQLPELDEMVEPVGNRDLERVKANHYVVGVEQQFDKVWSWTADIYYKDLRDVVISISDPADPDFLDRYSNEAEGKAYGAELVLNKALSKQWLGWLAVSLSKTERTNLRNGDKAPFEYDRPVMITMVSNYYFNDRWSLGFKWSYQSGALYTPIVDLRPNTTQPDILEPIYGEFNSERLPDYHRLDIRGEYRRNRNWGYWSAYIDLINAYDQDNIEAYDYSPNNRETLSSNPPGFADNIPVRENTMIGFFPSIGFEVQF